MRVLTLVVLMLFSSLMYGQETKTEFDGHTWEAPYMLPVPNGWAIERFAIPISFAPQIVYKGVEDIRFAPGWSKAESDEYWSYAFLWYLEGEIAISSTVIDSNLKAYYTGLIGINGAGIAREKLVPVEVSFKEIKKDRGDLRTFVGTVRMTDYMSKLPITLHSKVHVRSCHGQAKTFVFYKLSPKPLSHAVWVGLDKLWSDFKCSKE